MNKEERRIYLKERRARMKRVDPERYEMEKEKQRARHKAYLQRMKEQDPERYEASRQRNLARQREKYHQKKQFKLERLGTNAVATSAWKEYERKRIEKYNNRRVRRAETVESFMDRFRMAFEDPDAIKLLGLSVPDKEYLMKRVQQYDRITEQLKTMDPLDTMKNALNYKKSCILEDFSKVMSKCYKDAKEKKLRDS